jgi:hypothetical protein
VLLTSGRCVLASGQLDFGKPLGSSWARSDIIHLIPLLDDKADDKKGETGADEAMTIALISALGERVSTSRSGDVERVVPGRGRRRVMLERLLAMGTSAGHPADPRDQHAPSLSRRLPATRRPPGICRSCCWNRRKSSTASCRRPGGVRQRLNQLVLRGIARIKSSTQTVSSRSEQV